MAANEVYAEQQRSVRVVTLTQGRNYSEKKVNSGAEENFARLYAFARQSLKERPDIIVFPEFATTGTPYRYDAECARIAHSTAETVPGEGAFYSRYVQLAREARCHVCGWLVEVDDAGRYYNMSVLIDPQGGYIGKYRKMHPTEGEQYIWGFTPGSDMPVFDLGFAKVGLQICLDMDFPEGCRILMLKGADLILHPTVANDRRDVCPVRAKENATPLVVIIYRTASYAIDDEGGVIADMGETDEGGYLVADVVVSRRLKGKYGLYRDMREMYRFRRNPAAYGTLVDPCTQLSLAEIIRDENGSLVSAETLKDTFPYYE